MEGTNHEPFFSSQWSAVFSAHAVDTDSHEPTLLQHEEWLEGGAAHPPALTEGEKEAHCLLPDLPPPHGTQG